MRKLIGEDGEATPRASPEADEEPERESMLDWKPWKMGVAFSHRGRTLLIVKEECNVAPDGSEELEWLPAKRRIEIHVYVQEWFEVQNELQLAGHSATMLQNTFSLPGIATQLLAKISQHILSLAHNWFRGMLENELIYIPCWKCYSQMKPSEQQKCGEVCKRQSRYFPVRRRDEMFGVFAFNHEKCIIIAALNKDLECPIHGPIKVVHTAPDLVSWSHCKHVSINATIHCVHAHSSATSWRGVHGLTNALCMLHKPITKMYVYMYCTSNYSS